MTFLDWKSYRSTLMARINAFAKLSPDSVNGYLATMGAGAKTGHLDERTRQLISLAVAVTTRCDGCISDHAQLAVDAGASKEEIAEALGVAIAMNAGAALVYSVRALDAVEQARQ
jgi:AhpD family alkylhydroperoxidase